MKKPKPLATVGKIEIHRAKFRPFETVKYLDIAALKRAAKTQIEIGTVEGGGREITIVAEVRKGMITRLTPVGCKGCSEAKGGPARKGSAALKKELKAALARIREMGHSGPRLPIPIRTVRSFLDIDIGPITIEFFPFNLCITLENMDGEICMYCLRGGLIFCLGEGTIKPTGS
jgi:hypothetical protein